jgi:hypothetical protein
LQHESAEQGLETLDVCGDFAIARAMIARITPMRNMLASTMTLGWLTGIPGELRLSRV